MSMMYFLKTMIEKRHLENKEVVDCYQDIVEDFSASGNLVNESEALEKYLDLERGADND